MPSLTQTLTDSAPNGSTDDRVRQTWTKFKTTTNDDTTACLTTSQIVMSETTESNTDFQLSDKLINELQTKNMDCVASQEYQLNNAEQQSRWTELPSSMPINKPNDKIISQSKPTTGHFDTTSSLNISDRFIDGKVEKTGHYVPLQQQRTNDNNHLRNRYRVEQNIVFKPVEQARFYDAESGQFRENSSEKLPKRRSNSISCYHMYIGSGIPKPSSVVENNKEHFQQFDECSNRWKPSEDNRKLFDGTVYQWANGAIKDPVTEFTQGVSKSPSTSIQLPQASSPVVSNMCMSSSVNLSQQFYPTATLSHITDSSASHRSSNRPIQSARTPTEQSWASSNKWETRRLQQSSPVHPFSPAVDYVPLIGLNSPHCLPVSTAELVPASMGAMLYEEPPKLILSTSRASPTLVSLRSNEDKTHSPSVGRTHFLPVNETALARVRPLQHNSGMKSVNYDARMCSPSKSRTTSTLDFENNQQLTQPEEILQPVYYQSAHIPNSSFSQTRPVNATSNSLNTVLANEGKGGRLFARRRANSDAWIVGERDEPTKTVAKSTISNRNITGMQAMVEPDCMQRRRSLTAGHLQQPVHSEFGSNSHQYRSRTAQKLVNSFCSPRPFGYGKCNASQASSQ